MKFKQKVKIEARKGKSNSFVKWQKLLSMPLWIIKSSLNIIEWKNTHAIFSGTGIFKAIFSTTGIFKVVISLVQKVIKWHKKHLFLAQLRINTWKNAIKFPFATLVKLAGQCFGMINSINQHGLENKNSTHAVLTVITPGDGTGVLNPSSQTTESLFCIQYHSCWWLDDDARSWPSYQGTCRCQHQGPDSI